MCAKVMGIIPPPAEAGRRIIISCAGAGISTLCVEFKGLELNQGSGVPVIEPKEMQFCDEHGRRIMLRGVNLGGNCKCPAVPAMPSHIEEGFFQHRNVSFCGRPFPLEEADRHYARLRSWGFNCLRFLITWEAIEHAGPGIYDEEYLEYIYQVVAKAGDTVFMSSLTPIRMCGAGSPAATAPPAGPWRPLAWI